MTTDDWGDGLSEIFLITDESRLVQPPTYDLKFLAWLREPGRLKSLARKEDRKRARALGYRPSRRI